MRKKDKERAHEIFKKLMYKGEKTDSTQNQKGEQKDVKSEDNRRTN